MAEITVSVNAGKQYRLDEISFDRVTVFPESQLRDLFKINRGEVFDTEKIRVGLDSLRKLYASDGFINTTPVPNTIENREAGTISVRIDCDEGVQFRLGSLTLDGVEARPGAGAQLLAHWGQYQGRVFAPEQVEDFLAQNTQWLPTGVEMEKNVEIKQDQATRLANLVLRLPDAPTARN
jgi:outer membrane protein assembly factor BamA